jgi:hypothetical protein
MMMTARKVKIVIRLSEWQGDCSLSFMWRKGLTIPGSYRRGWRTLKNGGYTMALVRHTHTTGSGLSPEQIARLDEAAKRPITYDEDCPELTDEQLAEFRPVNFATMEERAECMRAHGLMPPVDVPEAVGK